MNRKYLIIAISVLLTLPVVAQTEKYYEYDEYGKVGRSEGWARRFAHSFVDGLVGAEYYEVYDSEGNKTEEQNKEPQIEIKSGKTYRHYGPGHTPGSYFGVNMLCNQDPLVLSDGFPQRPGKGFEFGFTIGQWGYHMTRNVGVNTALYLSRSRYWIDNNKYLDYVPNEDGERRLCLTNNPFDGHEVKQGYLRYWSLRVPFCLELSSRSNRGPFIAVGPELEYRFADVSKVDTYDHRKAHIVSKNLGINPIGLNAIARIGINDFGIIARYSFTSLFLSNTPVETYPFMVAISTSF